VDKVQFQTNVPQTLALKFASGKRVESRYNDYEVFYTLTDDRALYAPPALADKIDALGLAAGQPFSVCKREMRQGNKRLIEWQVMLVDQPGQTAARQAAPAGQTTQTQNLNGSSASPQNTTPVARAEVMPAQRTMTQMMGGALIAAIDALAAAREYGKTRGFVLDFNEEDIRSCAASIFIQYFREAENRARSANAAGTQRLNGGASCQ
jgi:hypothetical protein